VQRRSSRTRVDLGLDESDAEGRQPGPFTPADDKPGSGILLPLLQEG
jgi:hypothetical protein